MYIYLSIDIEERPINFIHICFSINEQIYILNIRFATHFFFYFRNLRNAPVYMLFMLGTRLHLLVLNIRLTTLVCSISVISVMHLYICYVCLERTYTYWY